MKIVSKVCHVAGWPIHILVEFLCKHHPSKKSMVKAAIGMVVFMFGSWLAHNCPHGVHHVVWETGCEPVRVIGVSPIVKLIADLIKIEV